MSRRVARSPLLPLTLANALTWAIFGLSSPGAFSKGWLIGNAVFGAFAAFVGLAEVQARYSLPRAIAGALLSVTIYIGDFALIYANLGTTHNWSHRLGRVDALYIALGTFTTAGTGSLTATSNLTRGLLSLQMGTGVLIAAFVIGGLAARVSRSVTP